MGWFDDRVALVTGASSGIGAALAREFAREGADVVLCARREERLEAVAKDVEAAGRKALVAGCDVRKDGDCERVVAAAIERFGKLDVVVANAGFGVVGRVDELALEDYRRQMEVNVFGVLRTFQAALPELKKSRGRFVVTGSVSGHVPLGNTSAYCMSKFAVRGWAEAAHDELARDGVTVTLVSPGFVETDIRRIDNQGKLREGARDPIPKWLRLSAEGAARAIVVAAADRKREVVLTVHGKAAVFAYRHFPWLVQGVLARAVGKKRSRAFKQDG
ncbi:MAG: SDR family oxidoreductase [Deltaproteobacteria bacterium]|nr:SDR family oxidoreductase [Deltaproteobacteria bacterium]